MIDYTDITTCPKCGCHKTYMGCNELGMKKDIYLCCSCADKFYDEVTYHPRMRGAYQQLYAAQALLKSAERIWDETRASLINAFLPDSAEKLDNRD